ncbi:hypothetical protein LT699_23675 [Pseudomonas syringae pv. syringae]|uniref:ABC-three component system protein n=1 Tax=Pseudomonas syringae TaxID=317 RepID=UPI00200B3E81|nr:ABC-three component system protein [Pseudomonas syringae]MCK9749591.1 hypothetical protein [Pseudomonas syringae pv. syringae]
MNPTETVKSHALKIDSGSGVLVECFSEEFVYAFTAKHVPESQTPSVTDIAGRVLECLKIIEHHNNDIDCSLLILKKSPELIPMSASFTTDVAIAADCLMGGYPDTWAQEKSPQAQVKAQAATITSYESAAFTIHATGGPPKAYIEGFSGSGVYLIHNGGVELIGIESGLTDEIHPTAGENYGSLQCYTINAFREIISINSLPELIPDFLSCYSKLQTDAFTFSLTAPTIEPMFSHLMNKANNIALSDIPKPIDLYKSKQDLLTLGPNDQSGLHTRLPWIHYFQHLLISHIIDKSAINRAYLKSIERRRLFIFHNTAPSDTWLKSLRDFLSVADERLDANGVIIVSTPEANPTVSAHPAQLNAIVRDIAYDHDENGQIDDGTNDILKSIRIFHITAIHRVCMIEQEYGYRAFTSVPEQMEHFRSHYSVYFGK